MGFSVLIPARLASTRLPGKPLADIGGLPMVVRVAQRAAQAGADQVVVAGDDARIVNACEAHGVRARADAQRPCQRQRPPGRSLRTAGPGRYAGGGQRAGRRALDRPDPDPPVRRPAAAAAGLRDEHRGAPHRQSARLSRPQHRQGGARRAGPCAVLQPRADSVAAPSRWPGAAHRPAGLASRGSVCLPGGASCVAFPRCQALPSSTPRPWSNCVCCGTDSALPCTSPTLHRAPGWTRPRTWSGCARCGAEPGASAGRQAGRDSL